MPNEIAIITGASSGIGRATALHLAGLGYDIGITFASNSQGAQETARRVKAAGRRVAIRQMEQTDPASIHAALDALVTDLGGVDVFVNNAGTLAFDDFLSLKLEDWNRVVACNLTGAFIAGQVIANHMAASGTRGRIVNLSSVHEAVPLKGGAAYCSSKAGVGMLTKCMALDLASRGIRVNAIGPGETATPMSGAVEGEDVAARKRPELPISRPGKPEEMAEAIAYLASPNANYTTGTTLYVDGGLLLMAAIGNQRTIMEALGEKA
ncbi:SDR family oxidoreductase [Mesorhizobium sp. M0047]|uniref:SDR family oxidoreductase n=1 Tax=Mesorhizobium sp. M0047 TaxID=2956859 RepID=UPI00333970E9